MSDPAARRGRQLKVAMSTLGFALLVGLGTWLH